MSEMEGTRRVQINNSALRMIYAMSFIDLFAVGVIFPFLGPYVKSLGCTDTQVGIFGSAYAALQVISGPIIGSWSDIRGRKSILFVTLMISTVLYFLMGFCTTLISLLILRLLLGMFKHTQTLNKAIITDLTGNDKQLNMAVYGRCTSFASIGFVFGPMVSGHLSEFDNALQYICSLTAFLFVINTILAYCLPNLKPTCSRQNRTARNELKIVVQDLRAVNWTNHWGAFLLKFFYIFVTTMFFSTQPFYLSEMFDAGKLEVGYVISLVSLVGVICGFCMSRFTILFYGVNETATLRTYHMFLLLTICFIGFLSVRNIFVFALLLVPFGVCNAVLRIVTMELVVAKCKDHERGSLTGASDSMMSLGRFLAPMTAGILADKSSTGGVMLYAALFSLLGTGVAYHLYAIDKLEAKYHGDGDKTD